MPQRKKKPAPQGRGRLGAGLLMPFIRAKAAEMGLTVDELLDKSFAPDSPHGSRTLRQVLMGPGYGGFGNVPTKIAHALGMHPDDFSNVPGGAGENEPLPEELIGLAPGELPPDDKDLLKLKSKVEEPKKVKRKGY